VSQSYKVLNAILLATSHMALSPWPPRHIPGGARTGVAVAAPTPAGRRTLGVRANGLNIPETSEKITRTNPGHRGAGRVVFPAAVPFCVSIERGTACLRYT
jgi:hypothetical protein